jgi:5'(3')-deoxyribonucleotidase
MASITEKLIISPNKGLLKGDILIDDIVEGKGQEHFEGELIHFGSAKFPDWESVLERVAYISLISMSG